MRKETCKCGKLKERRSAGNCTACHNAYMMTWRKENPFTKEQKEHNKEVRRKYKDAQLGDGRKRSPRLGAKSGILRPLCSWCNIEIENFKKKTFCKPCAAKYNREWRKKNPRSLEEKHKDNVRAKTRYRIMQGQLIKEPCEICGEIKVEAHHDNYDKPFEVRWLCIKHHHDLHGLQRRLNASSSTNNERCNH
jgi:hypothetical protein